MKTLRVYIEKNNGETMIEDVLVSDDIKEDEAEETAKEIFFNECSFGWEIIK